MNAQNNNSNVLLSEIQKCSGGILCRLLFGNEFLSINKINNRSISQEMAEIITQQSNQISVNKICQMRLFITGSFNSRDNPDFLLTKSEKQLKKRILEIRKIINSEIDKIIINISESTKDQLIQEEKDQEKERGLIYIYIKHHLLNNNIEKKEQYQIREEIIHQFFGLFFVGMITTSNLIYMTLYNLAENPKYLQQAYQEQQENENNEINVNFIKNLRFIDSTLKETLRIHTPIPNLVPRVALNDHYIGEFYIKKGDYVDVNILGNQMSDKIFENASQYNPNRWKDNNHNDLQYLYMPFNSGPRNCVGQNLAMIEAKVTLTYILRSFIVKRNKEKCRMIQQAIYEPENSNLIDLEIKNKDNLILFLENKS